MGKMNRPAPLVLIVDDHSDLPANRAFLLPEMALEGGKGAHIGRWIGCRPEL